MTSKTALTLSFGLPGGLLVPRAAKTKTSGETIGQRLARLRKERGITQIELAGELGVTQSHISEWERGNLRLHGELIATLAHLLGVSADELLGITTPDQRPPSKNRRLVRRLRDFDKLPKRDQEALLRTIDAFLSKAS
jgi:transcriptional regulator with XRE-family HTH domain